MKNSTTEAPKHRNSEIPASLHFRFPISHFGTVRRSVALLFCGLSPIYYLPSSIFFSSSCADTHSFCDAIHSEDTNLFQIMKKPIAAKTSFPLLPSVSLAAVRGPVVRGPLATCYRSNTFCSPIHSRDTHLL